MAVFEKTPQSKAVIDDTESLYFIIENAQNVNNHTEYILRVQRGPNKDDRWTVSRRYRDFAALHASLQQANIDLPLPPKKLIGNMHPSFIAERQIALQKYLEEVLKHQILSLSLQIRRFLDPNNYSLAIAEQALQTVSIALRGNGKYELKGPLGDIGWRIRKHYFLVFDTDSKTNCLLSWQNYGPDKYLNDKDLQTAFKCLQNVLHPYIDELLSIHNLETGAYIVRRIHENGSIRDMLYGTEYNKNHLAKYGNPKVRKPFTDGQIAHYGYQILQALKFLHDKGIPHGHIHPGNIAIENQRVHLMDIENVLMGVPCVYRPYLMEVRKATSAEAIDVYCFGRTLYEMAFARPLEEYYCDFFPVGVSSGLEYVLRLCLSKTSCKHGIAKISLLLKYPYFQQSLINGLTPSHDSRGYLKFPLPLKNELRNAVTATEERLQTEHKLVRKEKWEVRIQEVLNSEEEMKRNKRRAKERSNIWKSMSSLAETVHSQSASTASSPTPPTNSADTSGANTATPAPPTPNGGDARSALLAAVCSFDKSRLTRVNSR